MVQVHMCIHATINQSININSPVCTKALWRNGSASDSRSEGCVFKSRPGQRFLNICKFEETNLPQTTSTVSSTISSSVWAAFNSKVTWLRMCAVLMKGVGSSPALASNFL